ncbi:MAG: hypothetical protein A2V67_03950 [Deltaproteobacteria bacterium RBG_13_61_14]|nr:MAG: hypothetical protein A2V67_03950 [Deltaproteobacteria bacterium RBG_13_61_14]
MRIGVAAVIAVFWSLPAAVQASDCTAAYARASDHYSSFIRSPAQKKYHERWESLAGEFEAVAEKYPDCHKADDALYMAGKLRFDCYAFSKNPNDLEAALGPFQALIAQYPDSTLADDAQFLRGRCFELMGDYDRGRIEYQRAIQRYRRGDMVRQAQAQLAGLPQGSAPPAPKPAPVAPSPSPAAPSAPVSPAPGASPAQILTIRYWSSQDYTRVVVDLDREVEFLPPHLLKPDPNLGAPPRLYVDFPGTVLSQEFREQTPLRDGFYDLPIGDGLLEKARAGQHDQDAARVVLDLKSISDFHCFPLPGEDGGFRVVMDISGQKTAPARSPATQPSASASPATTAPAPGPRPTAKKREPAPAPAKAGKAPTRSVIVIDPGHGGKDPGAIGPGRTREKDVTLALAKKLKARLEKENPELKVVLTRSDDRYLSLVERTARANTLDADLFISIHCNASPNREAAGIETYYLDNTTDRAALKLAARENFVSEDKQTKADSITNLILADLQTTTKVNDSVPLAGLVQESLVRELKKEYSNVHDLGVKKAPFWVLTGARMPCVLVETSFISNRREEKRLVSSSFQDDLARAMARGIREYLNEHPELAAAWGE